MPRCRLPFPFAPSPSPIAPRPLPIAPRPSPTAPRPSPLAHSPVDFPLEVRMMRVLRPVALIAAAWMTSALLVAQPAHKPRPFGTLREQAAMQQDWLKKRLDTFVPALMRKHGVDLWLV